MIVNMQSDGWEIIYHRAHALLAADLGSRWRRSERPERFVETLAAISHHDDIEREWEGNELTEAGAPLDFTLSREDPHVSLERYKHLLDGARYRSRWITYLTAKHILFLSTQFPDLDEEWSSFVKELTSFTEEILVELGINKDTAERAYDFMHWCDRLSLILTRRELPEAGRSLEIISIEETRYEVRVSEQDTVSVTPWCFEEDSFEVSIDATYLSKLQYRSNEELRSALKSAPVRELKWKFSRTS